MEKDDGRNPITGGKSFIPSLGIIVTEECDLQCIYCPPHGENIWPTKRLEKLETILNVMDIAKRYGLEVVRITGGEPLLFPDRTKRILCQGIKLGFKKLILNTNGTQLVDNIAWLEDYKNDFLLKVSLDTLSHRTFVKISNRKASIHDRIMKGIIDAKKRGFHIEVNTVVNQHNVKEVTKIIEYVEMIDVHLKIFDIYDFEGVVKEQTLSLDEVDKFLSTKYPEEEGERLPGGRGIKMKKYRMPNGKHVLLVNHEGSLSSTKYYSSNCNNCAFYPCKTGRFQIPLTTDGVLLGCRLNRKEGIYINELPYKLMEDAFRKQMRHFRGCFEK